MSSDTGTIIIWWCREGRNRAYNSFKKKLLMWRHICPLNYKQQHRVSLNFVLLCIHVMYMTMYGSIYKDSGEDTQMISWKNKVIDSVYKVTG